MSCLYGWDTLGSSVARYSIDNARDVRSTWILWVWRDVEGLWRGRCRGCAASACGPRRLRLPRMRVRACRAPLACGVRALRDRRAHRGLHEG
eukprot:6203583-Pleurochrysis_carterae.AAC.1